MSIPNTELGSDYTVIFIMSWEYLKINIPLHCTANHPAISNINGDKFYFGYHLNKGRVVSFSFTALRKSLSAELLSIYTPFLMPL